MMLTFRFYKMIVEQNDHFLVPFVERINRFCIPFIERKENERNIFAIILVQFGYDCAKAGHAVGCTKQVGN